MIIVNTLVELLEHAAQISDHVMLWGFPEIIAQFVERIPNTMTLTAWLTGSIKINLRLSVVAVDQMACYTCPDRRYVIP
jgi:hypothetical protein